jgi:hypothetical protein
MASTHLPIPIRLPFEEQERHARLDTLTTHVANTLIEQYWTPEHIEAIDRLNNDRVPWTASSTVVSSSHPSAANCVSAIV